MRDVYQEQLWNLNQELIQMGAACEEIIDLASKALTDYSQALAEETAHVGATIDESERTIETICLKLLLRQQPVAGDLRQISAAMKMITDMERIGDQASDICEIATMGHLRSPRPEHFASMAQAAISMVHRAIDAYVHKDIELAQQVELSDDIVDALFNDVKADLIAGLRGHPDRTEECLDLLMIAKYLERIGDHAVNIAEWVIYAITGLYKGEELK